MNIVSLRIKNFLSIADVEIKPGQINQIVGKNNQGKTTVLKALEFAAKGSKDPNLVKFGEEAAEVIVELSDNTTIRRRLSAEGKTICDVRQNGFKAQAPQDYLDSLFENSAFNPIDLLEPKKRSEAILNSIDLKLTPERLATELNVNVEDLPPMDFDQHGLKVLEQAYKFYYQRRAEANKDAKTKNDRHETYRADLGQDGPKRPPHTVEQIGTMMIEAKDKIAEVGANFKRAEEAEAAVAKKVDQIQKEDRYLSDMARDIEIITQRMAETKKKKEEMERDLNELQARTPSRVDMNEQHVKLKEAVTNGEAMLAQHRLCDEYDKRVKQVADFGEEFRKAKEFANILTSSVEALAGEIKYRLMSEVDMPVEGLKYVDGEFFVNETPVDQLSTSGALKLAIGVARKLAKHTKLICIDRAEALDEESFAALREEIADDGYTYFLTKVGEHMNPVGPNDRVIRMENGAANAATAM